MLDADDWLLDQEPPAGYVREWTDRVAAEYAAHAAASSAFVFRVGLEWLALPATSLQEVVEPGPIHKVPHRMGGLLLGVTNIRGSLLLCIALEKMLHLQRAGKAGVAAGGGAEPESDLSALFQRMLVLIHQGHRVVVPVDEVHGLLSYDLGKLQASPATLEMAAGVYTNGLLQWNDKTVGLLDGELLFYSLQRSLNWIQGGQQI